MLLKKVHEFDNFDKETLNKYWFFILGKTYIELLLIII